MRRTALKGHALQSEGKPYERGEYGGKWIRVSYAQFPTSPAGVGLCECGATSPVLESNGARRRWHADHKEKIRRG